MPHWTAEDWLRFDKDEVVEAVDILLEHDEIDHAVSLGIAKKISGEGGLVGLSDKQMAVFLRNIAPMLAPACEDVDCPLTIHISDLPEAYSNRFQFGKLLCEECTYREYRLERLKDKDD